MGVMIAIGVVMLGRLQFFVGAFLGATAIYVVLRGVMFRMTERHGCSRWLAGLLLTAATALVLAGFGWISVRAVSAEVSRFKVDDLAGLVDMALARLNGRLGLHIIPEDIMDRSNGIVNGVVRGVLNTTYSFVANIVMMLIVLYFMLTSGRRMEAKLWAYAPFKDKSLYLIKREARTMIYSNVVGMPVILVLQTLVSTIIYAVLGFPNPWFWGFLTALCGLVPVLGTMIVYVPVAAWMVVGGQAAGGIVLLLYGFVVISNADNVFRIVLLRRVADTHPLVVIFGVIIGIPLFGFWGIIFGPLLISVFMLLIRIYYMEYGLMKDVEPEQTPVRKSVPRHFRGIHARMCKSGEQ